MPRLTLQPGDELVWVGDERAEDGDGDGSADLPERVEHRAGGSGLLGRARLRGRRR